MGIAGHYVPAVLILYFIRRNSSVKCPEYDWGNVRHFWKHCYRRQSLQDVLGKTEEEQYG